MKKVTINETRNSKSSNDDDFFLLLLIFLSNLAGGAFEKKRKKRWCEVFCLLRKANWVVLLRANSFLNQAMFEKKQKLKKADQLKWEFSSLSSSSPFLTSILFSHRWNPESEKSESPEWKKKFFILFLHKKKNSKLPWMKIASFQVYENG